MSTCRGFTLAATTCSSRIDLSESALLKCAVFSVL
eukprot:CAMPEP_0174721590 /NCGR_PEP_ID=MMETSP1094-20130205/36618_1 /TAXON_ID=156173 /ORGANISM="Chrysochromulina brevifilum, Strain UTEX LB 985" /LENGTH=34 /DNA_ID= /DNA_START= /DNA_END= /DNA_ORIENTATION=